MNPSFTKISALLLNDKQQFLVAKPRLNAQDLNRLIDSWVTRGNKLEL